MLMLLPIELPLTGCAIPLLQDNMDPTYFWFRDYSGIPPWLKIGLRILLILFASGHACIVVVASLMCIANVAREFGANFKSMSNHKIISKQNSFEKAETCHAFTKFGKSAKFPKAFLKYRQLSILTTVANQIFQYIIPVGLFIGLISCTVAGYFIIKISHSVPLAL